MPLLRAGKSHEGHMDIMKWTSAIATDATLAEAVQQCAEQVFKGLGRQEPDLLIAFVSEEHLPEFEALGELLAREFESAFLFGCCAGSVIGGGREIEDRPGLSITAAVLPNVRLSGAHLEAAEVPPVFAERRFWEEALHVTAQEEPCFLLLADPFSFEADGFLKGLDRAFPESAKIGGLASGGRQPGSNTLYLEDKVYHSGLITLAMTGDIELHTTLAQGSRPIGDPMFVTGAHDNLIRELDGRVPKEVLGEVYERLPSADRRLFSDAVYIGLAAARDRNEYRAEDFLVRSILGLDPQSGALWVGGRVETNSVVQLHLRDAVSAAQDVERSLRAHRLAAETSTPAAALLFSCLSRGAGFYGQPDHDSNAFRRIVADIPLGGFFCGGEIGQIRGATHVHGHTSAFGTLGHRTVKRQG
jgi:small ligand-binding sensory domain FIST